jgi:hypothetical protein
MSSTLALMAVQRQTASRSTSPVETRTARPGAQHVGARLELERVPEARPVAARPRHS